MNNISTDIICNIIYNYLHPLDQRSVRLTCRYLSQLKYSSISRLMIRYIDEYLEFQIGQKLINLLKKYGGKCEIYGSILLKVIHNDNFQLNDLDIAILLDDVELSDHFVYKKCAIEGLSEKDAHNICIKNRNREDFWDRYPKKYINNMEITKELLTLLSEVPDIYRDPGIHESYGLRMSEFIYFRSSDTIERKDYIRDDITNIARKTVSIQYVPESIRDINKYHCISTLESNSFDGTCLYMENPKDVISKVGYSYPLKYPEDHYFQDPLDILQLKIEKCLKYIDRGYQRYIHKEYLSLFKLPIDEDKLIDGKWLDAKDLKYVFDIPHIPEDVEWYSKQKLLDIMNNNIQTDD